MRIQKYLSGQGILSRREAERYMQKGLITVNGVVVTELGTQIDENKDIVNVIESASTPIKETCKIYKPRGVVTSTNQNEGQTIQQAFPALAHLYPIGRLDKESEGLLILSNDGTLTKKITGDEHTIEKEYIITVREDVLPGMITMIEKGIRLSDGMTLPAQAKKIATHTLSITLREGRKHQIRRMCDALKMTVESLVRIRIGNITLGSMKPGSSQNISAKDIATLKNL